MTTFEQFAERLRADIESTSGLQIYTNPWKSFKNGACSLRKDEALRGGVFAGLWQRIRTGDYVIQVEKDLVTSAGITEPPDHKDDRGWFRDPSLWWWVNESDSKKYYKIVGLLSKICQVR